jgi:hypothetical protein
MGGGTDSARILQIGKGINFKNNFARTHLFTKSNLITQ